LTATAFSATSIHLAWTAAAGATSYSVRRSTGGPLGPFVLLASGLTGTSSVDGTAAFPTLYHYLVDATGPGGITRSNVVAVVPLDPLPSLAQMIEPGIGSLRFPQAATDSAGNVIVVWTDGAVWSKRYDAATASWGPTIVVGGNPLSGKYGLQIAMNSGGTAVAVWGEYEGQVLGLYAARYEPTTGSWGAPAFVMAGPNRGRVGIDADGNALVLGVTYDGSGTVLAGRYSVSTATWSAPLVLSAAGNPDGHQLAVSPTGNAFAVWHQTYSGSSRDVYARRYDASAGTWGPASALGGNIGGASEPQVATNAHGDATVVWRRWVSTGEDQVLGIRYDAGGAVWGSPSPLANSAGYTGVTMDTAGNAIAIWRSFSGGAPAARRYDAALGSWGGTENLETASAGFDGFQVRMGAGGNAVAVWLQRESPGWGTWHIRSRRFNGATGIWDQPRPVENGVGAAKSLQLAMDPDGSCVVAVWEQDPASALWVNRFR
jgi:hypothetical protein